MPKRVPCVLWVPCLSIAAFSCTNDWGTDEVFLDDPSDHATGDFSADEIGALRQSLSSTVLVNECQVGSSGWIELYNPGASTVDLYKDPNYCWWVDDAPSGGSPRLITDSNVRHTSSSTTCSAAGRPSTCALIRPGERVWLPYASFNPGSPDQCRLLRSDYANGACGTSTTDMAAGGPTSANGGGECFGRTPDGGAWRSNVIPCTPGGGANGSGPGCLPGTACNDNDPCTTGEKWISSCVCQGTRINCGDGNECTSDACDSSSPTGCTHTLLEGQPCGTNSKCQGSVCVGPIQPLSINEFSAGSSGWIEIYNSQYDTFDASGYIVDDIPNGGTAPKTLPAGSVVLGHGLLVVSYAGFNTASLDQVRLLTAAGDVVDSHDNFYVNNSISGLCFGRKPNGGAWVASSIGCTRGASN